MDASVVAHQHRRLLGTTLTAQDAPNRHGSTVQEPSIGVFAVLDTASRPRVADRSTVQHPDARSDRHRAHGSADMCVLASRPRVVLARRSVLGSRARIGRCGPLPRRRASISRRSGTSTGRVSLLGPSLDHVPDGAGVRAQDAEVSWSHQVISVDELVRSPPCSTAGPNASDAAPASAASPGP